MKDARCVRGCHAWTGWIAKWLFGKKNGEYRKCERNCGTEEHR